MNNLVCGKFLNILSNTIIGVCVGLVVALVITLILHFTCFRERNMALLYVAMFLILALGGGFVQYRFFKEKFSDDIMPMPQDQVQTTIDTIQDKWQNTNGGFTFDQIKKTQEDDTAPTREDQIVRLDCYDFGSYIVFSYKSGEVYQNALFYKSPNGLIVDGMINMWAKIESRYKFPWWRYDVSTFKWNDMRNLAPYYFTKSDVVRERYSNLISLSSKSASFLYNHGIFVSGYNEACSYAMNQAAILTGNNVTSHFVKFGDVELIGTANTGYTKINSFYNYLYEQIRGEQYNSTKLVDANSVLCLPIAESLQSKYPIPESKKADYGDKEFYGVYKCDIAVELKFLKGSSTFTETDKNKEFFEDLDNDNRYKDKVKVEEVVSTNNYSKLNLSFKDTGNSDLTNLNLLTSPVTILFTNTETNTTKTAVVDSVDKLKNGIGVLLDSNANIRYEIRSNGLVFDNHDGIFKLTDAINKLVFDYYYVNNYVLASVGLNPIGTIDLSRIDLSINPVKIILKNDKHAYTFTFDDNSKFETKISQMVELGEYEYAILSDTLVFASTSGRLTITTTDRDMLFNCAQESSSENMLNLSVNTRTLEGPINHLFTCKFDDSAYALIKQTYNSTSFVVNLYFYDAEGKLCASESTINSSCAQSIYFNITNKPANGDYTVQVKVSSHFSDYVFLSSMVDITYHSYGLAYTLTLSL